MEISGMGSINEQIQGLMTETKQIVRDIFAQLEQYKNEMDEAMRKDALQKIQEDLEQLNAIASQLTSSSRSLLSDLGQIQSGVDNLRISGMPQSDAKALALIQQMIDDLKGKAQGLA